MNPIFTAILEETKATGKQAAITAMETAIESGIFYVEVVHTMFGQYSTGTTTVMVNEQAVAIPAIYASDEEVLVEIREEQSRYADEIEEGERDEGDEYEGELMMVKWDGGEMISFHCPDTKACHEEGKWMWHAGL